MGERTVKYRCPVCTGTTWRPAGFFRRVLIRLGLQPCNRCLAFDGRRRVGP